MVYIHNRELFSHKGEKNYVTFKKWIKMDGTGDHRLREISQTQKANVV
jgi:hypothetical protein